MVDAERQTAIWLEAGSGRRVAGLDRAGRDRRRGRLIPHAARLASHQRADRRRRPPGTVFVSREPTGETWCGEACGDDLILTRILTLEGLEDGVNRGEGRELARALHLPARHQSRGAGRPPGVAWLRPAYE